MANLQPSASVEPSIMASPSPIGGGAAVAQGGNDLASVQQLVVDLCDPALRKHALDELSKKKVMFQDRLAPLLWDSFGTIAALLQEILSIYPALSPPTLSSGASNRVCSVLALLQSVASHPETRMRFLDANIPVYLYPFLNTHSETRPFEYLRLTSLGVIGALVKVDDSKVISFLLKNEIVPLCLRCMEIGSELSKTCDFWTSSQHREVSFNQHVAAKTTKLRACFYFWLTAHPIVNGSELQQTAARITEQNPAALRLCAAIPVATFIVQKILIDDFGLRYMCDNPDRLFAVANLLAYMVVSHPVEPHVPTTARLLKHIIRCFRRLSDNANACSVLQLGLPDVLKDGTVDSYLVTQDDPGTRRCLQQLLYNVAVGAVGRAPHPGLY